MSKRRTMFRTRANQLGHETQGIFASLNARDKYAGQDLLGVSTCLAAITTKDLTVYNRWLDRLLCRPIRSFDVRLIRAMLKPLLLIA